MNVFPPERRTRLTDIAIVGGGLAGSATAAMLGRAGIEAIVIDPHTVYPPDFRCEKLDVSQIGVLRRMGLADAVLQSATFFDRLWVARYGRFLNKQSNDQSGIYYDALVNGIRDQIAPAVELLHGKVSSVETSPDKQELTLSDGQKIRARLIVLATGLNNGLRHSLGIERHDVSPCHSVSIGFDLKPAGQRQFAFPALTYYPERDSDRIAYLTLFPIGDVMRANLFVYRDVRDPWLRAVREAPHATIYAAMPALRFVMPDFELASEVKVRPVDLYITTGYRQPGVVLIGDAFSSSCPAAGTGTNKVFTDVERLCNAFIPRWLATEGMGEDKIGAFYDDPAKKESDGNSAGKARRLKSISIGSGIWWRLRRRSSFLGRLGLSMIGGGGQRLAPPLERAPRRVGWSLIDQILVSGVNALTGIILFRSLGLYDFGVYSMILIGVQFLAVPQGAAICAPMMSLFDQRGEVSQSSYLAAVLFHQLAYTPVLLALTFVAWLVVGSEVAFDLALVAAVTVATQFQDLSRRFFYVTERPLRALLSDVVAYGARFAAILMLAVAGSLTIDLVWFVMIVTGVAALALLIPDLARLDLRWQPIAQVTRSHRKTAGWMLGSSVAGVFSDNSFVMLVIGAVLGPAQLGAARAVQTIVQILNLLHQSLENFVPSAATKSLMQGGSGALLRYVAQVSLIGAGAIAAVIALLLVFADTIMQFVYGYSADGQLALIAAFGAYSALAHVGFVVTAGLRALDAVRAVFLPQVILSVASVALALYAVNAWGVVEALFAVLVPRALFTLHLGLALRRKAGAGR